MSDLLKYIAALVPSTGVGFLFYLVIRAMLEGDRRERLALSRWEASRDQPTPTPEDQDQDPQDTAPDQADPEQADPEQAEPEPGQEAADRARSLAADAEPGAGMDRPPAETDRATGGNA